MVSVQRSFQFDEIPVLGHQPDAGKRVAERLLEACQARWRERRGAPQGKEFSHDEIPGRVKGGGAMQKPELYLRSRWPIQPPVRHPGQ